mgnify:CR=1 FL=1
MIISLINKTIYISTYYITSYYVINSINTIQNISNTLIGQDEQNIMIPPNIKNNLKYLDYMQEDTQIFSGIH